MLNGRTENSVKNRFYSTARKVLQDYERNFKESEEFLQKNLLYKLLQENKESIKKTLSMQDYSKLYKELRNNINTKESPIPITTIPEIKVDP